MPKVFSVSFLWIVLGKSLGITETFRGNKKKLGTLLMYLYIFSLEYLFMVRLWICKCRSFQELLFTDILQNFAKFTLKHLCRSLIFDKVADRRPANSVKKRVRHWYFSVNSVKFSRTALYIEHPRQLHLPLHWEYKI